MSNRLERKVNKQVLRQMNKDTHDAMYKYLRNNGNDEADHQDFIMKLDAWKQEVHK